MRGHRRERMMAEEKARGGPRTTRNARSSRRAGNKLSSVLKNEDATQRKAALETAIRKKIECERKALQVVERLLEEGVTEDLLLDCGKLITPAHYKDVVEERSIIKLCGYPICQNRLQNVSKQKYKISTKTNKVYDITERKCFCSNFCYRASKYFESQVSQSPVWLREEERPPDIELLQQGARGHSGKEVKLVDEGIKPLDVEHPAPAVILSDPGTDSESSNDAEQEFVSSVLQENLSNAGKHVSLAPKKSKLKAKHAEKVQSMPITKEDAANSTARQLNRCHLENPAPEEKPVVPDDSETERSHSSRQSLISETVQTSEGLGGVSGNPQLVFLGVSQKGAEHLKRLLAISKHPVKHVSKGQVDPLAAKGNLLEHLRQTFTEWRTEETLRLLYGSGFSDASVQQQTLSPNCEQEELDVDDLDNAELLNAATLEEVSLDCLDLPLPFKDSGSAARSLPSYEKLKEETSQMGLKVREFYQGKFTLAEDDLSTQSEKEQQYSNTEDQQWAPIFPLVDFKAQQQIRIRIILEKLRKALPVVLGPLQIPLGDVYSEIRNLVKTFRLTNTNIIHKTPVWTLITIVLLSVLSEHIPVLANCQKSQGYTRFLSTLLEELHFQHEDFESLTRIFRRDCLLY